MKKLLVLVGKSLKELPFSYVTGMSFLFLLGAVAGCVAAANMGSAADDVLQQYLDGCMSLSKADYFLGIRFWNALLNAYKYQLAALLCGFSLLGIVLVPVITAARGFFLSFSVTAMVRTLGNHGILFALGLWGVQSLISVPVLFIISAQSFIFSVRLFHAAAGNLHGKVFQRSIWIRTMICAVLLFLCALFETFVTPAVVSLISGYIW